MNRWTSFFAGFLLGGIAVFGGLKYHLVRAADGFHLIPKTSAQFSGTFADIREYGVEQWQERPDLAVAIGRHDQELLNEAARQSVQQTVRRWWEGP